MHVCNIYPRFTVDVTYLVGNNSRSILPCLDLPQQVRGDQPDQDRQAGERLRQEVSTPNQTEAETGEEQQLLSC